MVRPTDQVYVNVSPSPAETNVSVDGVLTIQFSMDMIEETLNSSNIRLLKSGLELVELSFEYDAFRRILVATPAASLEPHTTYYIHILGNERDEADGLPLAGVLGVGDKVLIGAYSTFFVTEYSALEAPILTFPPNASYVSQFETTVPEEMFYWQEVEVYANDTTTTPVASGILQAETYTINGIAVALATQVNSYTGADNAVIIATAINEAGASVVAQGNADGTITLRHSSTGSANQVIIADVGVLNQGNLDELGELDGTDYIITAVDPTYEIEIAEDSIFSDPVFSQDAIYTLSITPGTTLPQVQLYWRVRASIPTATSDWSLIGTFYNGLEAAADSSGISIAPYYDPFKIISHSPLVDEINVYLTQIDVTFSDEVYAGSVTDSSISVVGKSLVSWEDDIGNITGTVELSEDQLTLTFYPSISFGATVTWAAPPSSWNIDHIYIYRSASKVGKYALLDVVYLDEATLPDDQELPEDLTPETGDIWETDTWTINPFDGSGTYVDSSAGQYTYWYRIEFANPDDYRYPQLVPIAGRYGGFADNQIYRVAVDGDLYSSDDAVTEAAALALGSDYVFYFTSRLYPLYINITDLETQLGAEFMSKFSDLDVITLILYNSWAAYRMNKNYTLNSTEYSLEQFGQLGMADKAKYFACFVLYRTMRDLLQREMYASGAMGRSVTIGDFSQRDILAGTGKIHPRIHELDMAAKDCLNMFSNAFYDSVANYAVKAAKKKGYYYSPYAPYEGRSWWSDKWGGFPQGW